MAHRGFSRDGLENSMAAFRAAVELGFRHLETDVHTTADGVLLLFHDETLDRVTDGRGRISELSAETVALARINGAEPIPLLDELVTAFPEVRLNLDVKDWGSVDPLAAAIERHGLHDRVLIASFSDRRRRAVLRQLTRPAAGSAGIVSNALFVLLGPVLPAPLLRLVAGRALRGVHALQVPVSYGAVTVVTPGLIRRAHRHGPAGPCLDHQRAGGNAPLARPRRRRDRHRPRGPAQGGPAGARVVGLSPTAAADRPVLAG